MHGQQNIKICKFYVFYSTASLYTAWNVNSLKNVKILKAL